MHGAEQEETSPGGPATASGQADREPAVASEAAIGERLGPYRIERPLGHGGMGSVFLAVRDDAIRQAVAVKILDRPSRNPGVLQRFEQERRILASLDHPHIARIIDAGRTPAGLPYFVMEYVDGVPITQYCIENRLSTAQRLELLCDVLDGVTHAHQRLVIHRDLKPANILVRSDGVVKLLDFGVAKLLDPTERRVHTATGQTPFTPGYAAPEQLKGEAATVATDVYMLGVLLYEMVTEVLPFDSNDVASLVSDTLGGRPPAPSRVRRGQGAAEGPMTDLDHIALMALRKEPARRYASVDQLARDVRAYLTRRPVAARPDSLAYQISKLVQRNPWAVVGAGAITLALVGGVALSQIHARQLAVERDAAEAARAQAETARLEMARVAAFQEEQLRAIEPNRFGAALRAALLEGVERLPEAQPPLTLSDAERARLEAALARLNLTDVGLTVLGTQVFAPAEAVINQRFAGQPLVRARLLQTLATTLRGLGRLEQSQASQETALSLFTQQLGSAHAEALNARVERGVLAMRQGRFDAAERDLTEALVRAREALGPRHRITLESTANLGDLRFAQGRAGEAERLLSEAVTALRAQLGVQHPETLQWMRKLGTVLGEAGRLDAAETLLSDALAGHRARYGDRHHATLATLNELGILRYRQGRIEESERLFSEALAGQRELLGSTHGETLALMNNVAALRVRQDKLTEALGLFEELLSGQMRILGPEHVGTLTTRNNYAGLLRRLGRLDEAEREQRAVLAASMETLGPDSEVTLRHRSTLGLILMARNELDAAEEALRTVLERRAAQLAPGHPDIDRARANLAALLNRRGAFAEAETLIAPVVERRARTLNAQDPATLRARAIHAEAALGQGRHGEAEGHLREVVEQQTVLLGPRHLNTLTSRIVLAQARAHLGQADRALAGADAALGVARSALAPDHPDLAAVLRRVALVRATLGDDSGANALLAEADAIGARVNAANDLQD